MVKQVVGEVAASGTALAIIGIRNKISCAARCQTPQRVVRVHSARGCSLYCLESDEDETGAINAVMCKPIYNFFLAVHLKPSDSYLLLLKTALTR